MLWVQSGIDLIVRCCPTNSGQQPRLNTPKTKGAHDVSCAQISPVEPISFHIYYIMRVKSKRRVA